MALKPLPFTSPYLLAPMEGVTEPAFRDLVLAEHDPTHLGGAYTEFVRVSQRPVKEEILLAHLGPRRFPQPVGLQLMGNELGPLAESAQRAIAVGAPLVDLNFGCPARGPFASCAGSALLADPPRIESIIRALVDAVPDEIVTAKIRSGITDDLLLEDIARAVEAGGARMLTIHCRTRKEGYQDEAIDWNRIRRAVETVSIPVCGNGGVTDVAHLETMRRETGCEYVMVGRGALADPWVFSGRKVTQKEAADFLLRYAAAIEQRGGTLKQQCGRLKQLINLWTAADLIIEEERRGWLRQNDPQALFDRLDAFRNA